MHKVIFLLLAAMLAAPLASAGGADASVTYLESSEDCKTSYESDYHEYSYSDPNATYWYQYWSSQWGSVERCDQQVTTLDASASADGDEVAGAHVGGHDATSESDSTRYEQYSYHSEWWGYHYDSSGSSRSYSYSTQDSQERHVEARALGQRAAVENACSDSVTYNSSYSENTHSTNTSSSTHTRYTESSDVSDSCWQGVSTDAAGRDTRAGRDSGCERRETSEWEDSDWSYTWDNQTYTDSSSRQDQYSEQSCRENVVAGSGDLAAAAGPRSDCQDSYSWYSSGSDSDSDNSSSEWSYDSWEINCTDSFLLAEGPDGARVFVGGDYHAWSSCYSGDTECWDSSYSAYYAEVAWKHSPLGGEPTRVYIPLLG